LSAYRPLKFNRFFGLRPEGHVSVAAILGPETLAPETDGPAEIPGDVIGTGRGPART
jgi:hypothetical protein